MNIVEAKNHYLELKPCENWIESVDTKFFFEFGETLLSELEKQEKIIEKMAEQLTSPIHNKEWVIEYFKNKVEREVEQ